MSFLTAHLSSNCPESYDSFFFYLGTTEEEIKKKKVNSRDKAGLKLQTPPAE